MVSKAEESIWEERGRKWESHQVNQVQEEQIQDSDMLSIHAFHHMAALSHLPWEILIWINCPDLYWDAVNDSLLFKTKLVMPVGYLRVS